MTDDDASHRRLWASVIIQHLIDATAEGKTVSSRVYREQARAWLTAEIGTTAQDFEEVCMAAGFEPGTIRKFINNYEGPPLTLHVLSRMRNAFLNGETDGTT